MKGEIVRHQYLQHGCHEKIGCLSVLFNKERDSPKEINDPMHLQSLKPVRSAVLNRLKVT